MAFLHVLLKVFELPVDKRENQHVKYHHSKGYSCCSQNLLLGKTVSVKKGKKSKALTRHCTEKQDRLPSRLSVAQVFVNSLWSFFRAA